MSALVTSTPLEDDEIRLLAPSGLDNEDELEEEVLEDGSVKPRLISLPKEQRAAALGLLVEPLRQVHLSPDLPRPPQISTPSMTFADRC